jgi:hypothetical protein
MRRFSTVVVLFAWLLASGAQWDVLQGFAWGRMIATYSRTMPFDEAVRLTFTADNLCNVCEFVADSRTRADGMTSNGDVPAADTLSKAKAPLATPPAHVFVFASLPALEWPREDFRVNSHARPAPPTEPPRAA